MENLQWLTKNSGPALRLRMMNEQMIHKDTDSASELLEELMQIEKVRTALTYFDKFKDFKSMPDNILYGFVHNCYEDSFEMFMPFFTKLGFTAGIPILDEKVGYMREIYQYFITPNESGELHWSHVHGLSIILYLLEAGYVFHDMMDYMTARINKAHKITEIQEYDFYETDPLKIRPRPKIWKDTAVLKDIHNCEIGEFPLPTIYTVMGMLYLYRYINDDEMKKKIDDIIIYILDPRYQKTRGDYGIHWSENNTYHASAGGVRLPLYEDDVLIGNERYSFLNILNLMSYSPIALASQWFQKSMDFLEEYKTERGTYIFPDDFLYHTFVRPANSTVVYGAYISKDVLPKIKRNERRSFAIELVSTFFVQLMKKRMILYNDSYD